MELNAGFNLGVLYLLALYWSIRQVDKRHYADGTPRSPSDETITRTGSAEWTETLFLAFGGSLLLYFMGFEYFYWTGIALSAIYFGALCLTTGTARQRPDCSILSERRKNVSLLYSAFLLLFLMFHGGSERAGILLRLYPAEAVNQYAWPTARIILFAPVALTLVVFFLLKIWRILRAEPADPEGFISASVLSMRITDLMTAMGFIGALSIWPTKIGVLYALLLFFAIFAFNRMNHRFDAIDLAG